MGKKAVFQDPEFRPNDDAIHEITFNGVPYVGNDVARVVEWRRLKELPAFFRATDGKNSIRLFEDGVQATDINQGALGDCWLLSSLACLATRSGAVEKLFLTPEYNEEGRYQLRLWDKQNRRFKEIIIDDTIPVWRQGGQPCFAQPTGNEAWVLLLEKAMAKYVGSYHFLNGGMASWGLETLTGHYTCVFLLEKKFGPNRDAGPSQQDWRWLRAELATKPADRVVAFGGKASPLNRSTLYMYDESDLSKFYSHEEVFMAIVYHLAIGNLVAAATVGTDDDTEVDGVVRAHAYTVMAAKPVNSNERGQLLMIQVRNPHGSGGLEWSGDWSDRSTLWVKHPEVAEAVGYTAPASVMGPTTDGCFWMEWRDFVQHFKEITFCCVNGFDYVEDDTAGWKETFVDPSFPHDHRSLGDYKFIFNGQSKTGALLNEIIKWLRLQDIAAPDQFRRGARGLRLFAGGGTHPDDIDGGSTGLMVAVACLANKPGAIEELFVSGREYRPDGAYQVRLYEPRTGNASIAPFDDWIPCYNGSPITKTQILGSEVWVLLLEKAVARLVESYSKVSMWGVQVCWALACLTGQYTCLLMWEETKKKWRRLELQFVEKQPAQYRAEYTVDEQSLVASEDVFGTLSIQLLLGCLVAAETDKEDVASDVTGLAKGRNYSVLDARTAPMSGGGSLRLVKLRDPARKNEWKGDWSDSSSLWGEHPEVAKALEFRPEAEADDGGGWGASSSGRRDGSFWMTFEDFLQHFRLITLCGNSLRGNLKPWTARQADLDAAERRLGEARRQQALRAEQEALEDSQHAELRKRAVERARGPKSGTVFAKAALSAAANVSRRPSMAALAPVARKPAASNSAKSVASAAPAPAAATGADGEAARPGVEVVSESKAGPCKSCALM
ncbi:hypothetical protein PLESTB_000088800 [Pleodorina starrii]|uniref:Calpain catalytic domain-containing protein n=1 Tax=Pleodorina starrii TaxID=330485 RepID=A0A9W6BA67_9CHLO|nr:hypothetical protein PLESTM_000085200 [Pleodorina starrii]GLC48371.1 hypothetical protein PLESTB_000088800 [Pleodorina starrii]GLC76574.1 hypothetical protein PLESTF_001799000 [Pleodorina starrii]